MWPLKAFKNLQVHLVCLVSIQLIILHDVKQVIYQHMETQTHSKSALLITGSKTFRHVVESPLGLRLLYLMALALLGYGLPLSAVHLISPTSHYGPGRWPVLTTLGHQNLFWIELPFDDLCNLQKIILNKSRVRNSTFIFKVIKFR